MTQANTDPRLTPGQAAAQWCEMVVEALELHASIEDEGPELILRRQARRLRELEPELAAGRASSEDLDLLEGLALALVYWDQHPDSEPGKGTWLTLAAHDFSDFVSWMRR